MFRPWNILVSYSWHLLNPMMDSEKAETCRSINNIITDNKLVVFLTSLHSTFTLHTQRGCLNSKLHCKILAKTYFVIQFHYQPYFIVSRVNNILLVIFSLPILQSSFSILFTQLSYCYSLATQNDPQPNTDFLNTELCQHWTVHTKFLTYCLPPYTRAIYRMSHDVVFLVSAYKIRPVTPPASFIEKVYTAKD
jgi:hypothetical protein